MKQPIVPPSFFHGPATPRSLPALDKAPALPELRSQALQCLAETSPSAKVNAVFALAKRWTDGKLTLDAGQLLHPEVDVPGRPPRPQLVPPLGVQHRSMRTVEGRAALVHALAHIEFNAINLALDAIWRFAGLPDQYYADWLRVASEEALHFDLLSRHLNKFGFGYGDFPAHNSLWDMAHATSGDALARMALVPRTLEARGLDASPAVRAKLAQAGDHDAAAILDIILRDEIGHVAVGNHWYGFLCGQRNLDPMSTFDAVCRQYRAPAMRGPFNLEARRAAGFTEPELAALVRGSAVHGQPPS